MYNAASEIIRVEREDNITIYYGYDQASRLTSEKWHNRATDASIYAFAWDYSKAGNRTFQDFNGTLTYYQYSSDNSLSDKVTNGAYSYYQYDSRG